MVAINFTFNFSLSLFCSRCPVDWFRKNEDSSYVMSCSHVYVSHTSWKLPHIFFVSSLPKPIRSHWFKRVLLEFFSLYLYLFLFHKMMEFYKAIFSAWISSTSAKHFFSQKYNRNIFDLLKFTCVDFFRLFGFWQESHWIYTVLKNYI